jgi:hypothetical protein
MSQPTGEVVAVTPTPVPDADQRRQTYNRVVRLAKLTSILLEKIDFKISPEAYGLQKSLLKRELNVTTDLMSYDSNDGVCIASIQWSIVMKFRKKNVAKCAAHYIIMYEGITGCPEDIVKIFIDHVGKTATYAYFRALYAHLDWSANLGSAPLPVVQFQPKI